MRLLALTCEVLARSVYLCAARSANIVDIRLQRRGLHDDPPDLRSRLQSEIDAVGPPFDAVVLAYGLCGGAIAGLQAQLVPLVVPRAHDCITLFLGDRFRYRDEFARHPGTFWYVQDYLERSDEVGGAFAGVGAVSDAARAATHAEYVERYGADNADYLMDVLGTWTSHYDRAAYVDMGVASAEAAEARARAEAEKRGWTFERLDGEPGLMRRLIDGDWAADFLVLQPGQRIAPTYDDDVLAADLVSALTA